MGTKTSEEYGAADMIKLPFDKINNNYNRIMRAVFFLMMCVLPCVSFNSPVYALSASEKSKNVAAPNSQKTAATEKTATEQTETTEQTTRQDDTWETTQEQKATEESSLQDLKREYEQVKKEADANKGTVSKLATEIREMNLRMADEARLIEKADKELSDIDIKIGFAERSLIEYEEDLAVEKDRLYNSIRMEYEDGSRSLLSILLNVDRFSEIGDRLEYSNKINNYISEKMNAYSFMMDMVSKTRDSLDELRKQREEELIEYDKKRAKFKSSIADMTELMKEAKEKADNANTFASELQTEIARMEAEERMLMIKNGYNQTASQNSITYTGNGTDYYYRTPFAYTEEELLLLAGIIEAEAGSSHYPGMVAVGSVVMNRIESPRYDNTIEGVIYAEGQFEPVRTGRLAVILARGPAVSCIGVAKEVLDGKRNVPYLAFKAAWYAEEHGIEGVNIGGNVFH